MGKIKRLKWALFPALLMTLVLAGGCLPGAAPAGDGDSNQWTPIIFLVLLFGIFYFLLIRPQRKKQKEHQTMVEELKRGDRIITAGGIYGQIESIGEDNVVIKVESGMTMRVARGSVAGIRDK